VARHGDGVKEIQVSSRRKRAAAHNASTAFTMVRRLLLFLLAAPFVSRAATENDWPSYLGDGGTHYSALRQIDRTNVGRLQPAWTFHTGDSGPNTQIQCNPIIVDGVLYGNTPQHKLFALDAATGRELWRFDPFAAGELTAAEGSARRTVGGKGVNRGVVLWQQGAERRLLYSASHYLHAIDPATGRLIEEFGDHGRVDLLAGLDRDVHDLFLVGSTPGAVYRDLIIVSTRVAEGPGPAAPGHICAYDVHTGKRRWIFHTIPWPGEVGHETWSPNSWQEIGGANCWGGLVIDQERGIAFVPTGSAAFDFWGGNRIGDNLFADCLIALDAETGKRKWHFQIVHHDLWDRDLPAAPTLCEVQRNGRRIAAVAQITKAGYVWVFDRETGESLFPWAERAVPPSTLMGEHAASTQPFPLKPAPFARQQFTEQEVTDISPADHDAVLARFKTVAPHVQFDPPNLRGTIIFPGFDGGGEWGGAAVDPRGVLYVNANEMPWILQLVSSVTKGGVGPSLYGQLCISCHGVDHTGNKAANIPSLVGVGARLKSPDIDKLLQTGKGVMPNFAFLSASDRTALIAFLLGTAKPDEVIDDVHGKSEPQGDVSRSKIPYAANGYNRFLDPEDHPAVRPPWGTLNAINLNTGEYEWKRPLGEVPELTARGVPLTGTENYGGPLVTAGGLVFIAATKDERFRAFDSHTGEMVWETKLPAGGYATPACYAVNGTQYVVIACGGGKMGTASGDSYVSFALPAEPAPTRAAAAPVRGNSGIVAPGAVTGTLHVQIVDEAGYPMPARAWIEQPDRRHLFRPSSPVTCTPYQQDRSFSCDGEFEITVPAGHVVVHVEKGKEFVSVDEGVEVAPHEAHEMQIHLKRWIDMAARGYYSADFHVHFGSDDPRVLRQLSLADDVNVVPAFSYWLRGTEERWPTAWPDGGAAIPVDSSHVITRSNLEIERITRKDDFGDASGAAFIFNLNRPLTPGRADEHYPSTTDLCLAARKASPECVIDTDKPSWAESVVGAALGAYDVVQVCHNHYHRSATLPGGWGMMEPLAAGEKALQEPDELFRRTNELYYHWLNCGFHLAVSGGSAIGVMPEPTGFSRTYAKVDGPLTPESFWSAVKAGRTFATSGPMLTLTADGREMGSTLERSSNDANPVKIAVDVGALGPLDAVELVENGQVVKTEHTAAIGNNEPWTRRIEWSITPTRSGWYAARTLYTAPDGRLREAHTSPIYVRVDAKPIAFKASAEYMVRWIDQLIAVAQTPGRFTQASDRDAVIATYRRARDVYLGVERAASDVWHD
jgi:quinoprotein glucose dehydrogenase